MGETAHYLRASLVDVEQAIQAADPENAHEAPVRRDQGDGAGAQAPCRHNDHSKPGGVDEGDLAQVDDDRLGAFVDALRERVEQARRRVDVDLTLNDDDRDALSRALELHVERESRPPQRSDPGKADDEASFCASSGLRRTPRGRDA